MRAALPMPAQPAVASRPEPTVATPTPAAGARDSNGARPPGAVAAAPAFAQLLHAHQQIAGPETARTASGDGDHGDAADSRAADAETAEPTPAQANDDATPADAAPRSGKSKPSSARPPRPALADKPGPSRPEADAGTSADTAPARTAHDAAALAMPSATAMPGVAPIDLAPPAPAAHAAARGSAASAAANAIDADAGNAAWPAGGRPLPQSAEPASAAPAGAGAEPAAIIGPAKGGTFGDLLALENAGPPRRDPIEAAPAIDRLLAPAPSVAPLSFVNGVDSSALPTIAVATPVDSADFMPAFALQVSVLASSGAQHAELQLHPAEMGPVSVQISLEGKEARVDFGADSAATRQLIEAGLPDLAGALREAGFTLTGGGVSAHAGGRGGADGQADRGPNDRTTASADPTPPAPVPMLRQPTRIGAVDLYA